MISNIPDKHPLLHTETDDSFKKYRSFFRPAKYLIPAAIFALLLGSCNPDAPGGDDPADTDDGTDTGTTDDGTGDDTTVDPATVIGNPAFNAPIAIPGISTFSSYIFIPALADMDSDGDLDIIAGYKYLSGSSFELAFKYFKNDTTTSLSFAASNELLNLPAYNIPDAYSSGVLSPLIPAVFDNDGDKDIIFSKNYYDYYPGVDKSQTTIFSAQNTANTFDAPAQQRKEYHTFSAGFLVDLDGDSDLDLAVGTSYQSSSYSSVYSQMKKIIYFANAGDNNFSDKPEIELVAPASITNINQLPIPSFADIDDDGDQDMFTVTYNTGAVTFYLNTGTAAAPVFEVQASAFGVIPSDGVKYFPAFGDMDGDTDLDVIVGTDDGRLLYIENTDIE